MHAHAMYAADPDLRASAATALEALANSAATDRDDVVAAILIIESEAERLGDHGLEALGERLRVIALLDTPRADDAIRPVLRQLAATRLRPGDGVASRFTGRLDTATMSFSCPIPGA